MNSDEGVIFPGEVMARIFPPDRSNRFFEALFGDPAEGAFDIRLEYVGSEQNRLTFAFKLKEQQ